MDEDTSRVDIRMEAREDCAPVANYDRHVAILSDSLTVSSMTEKLSKRAAETIREVACFLHCAFGV